MRLIPLVVLAACCLPGCATAYLREDHSSSQVAVRIIASGAQDLLVSDGECYLEYRGAPYLAIGLHDQLQRFDRITFWVEDRVGVPTTYQLTLGDMYVAQGRIVRAEGTVAGAAHLSVSGAVATCRSVAVPDLSRAGKLALTPFALAADLTMIGGAIASMPLINPGTVVGVAEVLAKSAH